MPYMPKEIMQLTTAMELFVVDRYEKTGGVSKPIYKKADKPLVYCNFKTYGGKETTINGRYVILDTAYITTWYRPDITSGCLMKRMSDGALYEIINEPDNVEQGNRYLKFTVQRYKGKA